MFGLSKRQDPRWGERGWQDRKDNLGVRGNIVESADERTARVDGCPIGLRDHVADMERMPRR
jgi:hypothetical protein